MREVPVHAKRVVVAVALVDDADYELVADHHWRLHTAGYAARSRLAPERHASDDRLTTNAVMQRQIMGLPAMGWPIRGDTLVVDHVNGDRLDNRRENLEIVTQAENIRRGQRRRWERWRAAAAAA